MTAAVDDRLRSRIPDHEARGVDDGAPDMSELIDELESHLQMLQIAADDRDPHAEIALRVRDLSALAVRLREGSGTGGGEATRRYRLIGFHPADGDYNAVVYPEEPHEGPHWTLIGGGPDEDQSRLAEALCERWNRGVSPSPSKVDEGEVEEAASIIMHALADEYRGGGEAWTSGWTRRAAREILSTLRAEQEPDKGGI